MVKRYEKVITTEKMQAVNTYEMRFKLTSD